MADLQLTGITTQSASGGKASVASASAAAGAVLEGAQPASAQAIKVNGGAATSAPQEKAQVKSAIDEANQALAAIGTQLKFVFDDQAQHMEVKLVDIQTQKVVQSVLPKAMLDTAGALAGTSSSGALVDTKA